MKVCHILYSGLGGVGAVVFALLDGGGLQCWENSLLLVGNTEVKPDYVAYCQRHHIPYAILDNRHRPKLGVWLELYRQLQRLRPTVVCFHGPSYIVPVALYCRRYHARCVGVEHTALHIKSRQDYALSLLTQLWADRIVLLTHAFQQQFAQRFRLLFQSRKNAIIANGVDLDKFQFRVKPPPVADQPLLIGMAARFSASKHHDLLLRVMQKLAVAGIVNVHLSLAGDGETLPLIQQAACERGLDSKVVFCGGLSEAELVAWYATLDIYVQASAAETMCTVVLQALSCGVPIVASNIEGINDIIPAHLACLVDNSVGAFAEALTQLSQDDARRCAMAVQGRAFCVAHYSNKVSYEQYNALFEEIEESLRV